MIAEDDAGFTAARTIRISGNIPSDPEIVLLTCTEEHRGVREEVALEIV